MNISGQPHIPASTTPPITNYLNKSSQNHAMSANSLKLTHLSLWSGSSNL